MPQPGDGYIDYAYGTGGARRSRSSRTPSEDAGGGDDGRPFSTLFGPIAPRVPAGPTGGSPPSNSAEPLSTIDQTSSSTDNRLSPPSGRYGSKTLSGGTQGTTESEIDAYMTGGGKARGGGDSPTQYHDTTSRQPSRAQEYPSTNPFSTLAVGSGQQQQFSSSDPEKQQQAYVFGNLPPQVPEAARTRGSPIHGIEEKDTTGDDNTDVFGLRRGGPGYLRGSEQDRNGGSGGYLAEGNVFGDENAVGGGEEMGERKRSRGRGAGRGLDSPLAPGLEPHLIPGSRYPEEVPQFSSNPDKIPDHIHPHHPRNHPRPTFLVKCITEGFQIGSFISTTITFLLIMVMGIAVHVGHLLNPFWKKPPGIKKNSEYEQRITGERYSARTEYYIEYWGYKCEDVEVETEDGFLLKMHHIIHPKRKRAGRPVLIMHGILSNSVTFVVNEERSLAFWLLEKGYDVWLGNVRGNLGMKHRSYSRRDPRFWSWGLREMGMYDCTAMINHVYAASGNQKVAYIGHSQGTGIMFTCLAKGVRPEIARKMSSFIALGPAVFAGPVLRSFPFSLLRLFRNRKLWGVLMGEREFIPIMSILQQYTPGWLFGHLGFAVFAFIFGFHDHNWIPRQIPKFFRSVPVPNSSELLYYYMAHFSYNNCLFDTNSREPWFPPEFPPLMIAYGTIDTLVVGPPLVKRIRDHEPHVRLMKAVALENYEHLDMIWGANAVEDCFSHIKEMLEETKEGRV